MRAWLASVILLLALGIAQPLISQERATLVADSVALTGTSVIVAQGHVEVFFQGRRVTASLIRFDGSSNRLQIEGPIVLTDDTGTFIIADQADLAADLTNGILTSARVVLNQQMQIAAAQVQRVDGRFTAMERVAASSCKVCAGNPTPLWEIRARRVVHDQVEQQLYFDEAQLRFAGMPIFYLPRLRMPDPTLKRATGFMMPTIRTTTALGTGLKMPYFITLGRSRDVLITPYISSKSGRTVELRYRQAFATGDITLNGAISRDTILPGETRAYFQGLGSFDLPRSFKLTFKAELVSDPSYLLDYGYPEKDRLDSRIEINRTRRNEYISGRLIGFHTTRLGESDETIPSIIGDLTYHRRFTLGTLGGEGGLRFQTHSAYRTSNSLLDGDLDGIPDGRDVTRASIRADWRKNWVLSNGMMAAVLGEATADLYSISQDPTYGGVTARSHANAGVELRWPLLKTGKTGVSQLIEPVAQLILSSTGNSSLPNEDSALVEFDEGNLFALNRFPGADAVERGVRANLGINYLRLDPAGWSLGVTVGRVVRADDLSQFSAGSGLDGVNSDWLAAFQIKTDVGLDLTSRVLLEDNLTVTKGELRLGTTGKRYSLDLGYVQAVADLAESRPLPTRELTLDSSFKLSAGWTANLAGRYDLEAERAGRAGVGLSFRNECLAVDLSLSRRFTSSTSVTPTTDFGLSVALLGFGGSASAGPARQCRQ